MEWLTDWVTEWFQGLDWIAFLSIPVFTGVVGLPRA